MNLIPLEKPADIYRAVAEKSIKALEELAAEKRDDPEIPHDEEAEKAALQQQAAQWWLDYGLTRKDTKRNCMTFPYGSKQRGFIFGVADRSTTLTSDSPHLRNKTTIKFPRS